VKAWCRLGADPDPGLKTILETDTPLPRLQVPSGKEQTEELISCVRKGRIENA
jgi:hypothetical protein